jgi:hypothetical protein
MGPILFVVVSKAGFQVVGSSRRRRGRNGEISEGNLPFNPTSSFLFKFPN